MKRTKFVVSIWLVSNFIGAIVLILMPGRKIANAHPFIRGGSDHGFGGLDFYEKIGDSNRMDTEYHF